MAEKVTVTVSDETAEELRQAVNERRNKMARQKAMLRHGAGSGSEAEELSESHETDTETAIRASIKYTLDDLK